MPTDPWTTMDKAYGHGWYFTDLDPNKCDAFTIAHCWRSSKAFKKIEYYLKFQIPDHLVKKCREHVYMLDYWDKTIKYLEGNKNKECTSAPCESCNKYSKIKNDFSI